jgi:hypothetical protein
MALDDKTREKLRENARKRRGVILKDVDPMSLYALTDKVKEDKGWGATPVRELGLKNLAYLRYASEEQIRHVAGGSNGLVYAFFSCEAWLTVPSPHHVRAYRKVVLFEARALSLLLKYAGVSRPHSYVCDLTRNSRLVYPVGWRQGPADGWHFDVATDSRLARDCNWIALLWRTASAPPLPAGAVWRLVDPGPEVVLGHFDTHEGARWAARAHAAKHPVPKE